MVAQGMETGDWRAQLPADYRQQILNKILDTLKSHLPFSGEQELRSMAVRFEEKIYTEAISQSDYLRNISIKMLIMEKKTPQNPMVNSTQSNDASDHKNPRDPDKTGGSQDPPTKAPGKRPPTAPTPVLKRPCSRVEVPSFPSSTSATSAPPPAPVSPLTTFSCLEALPYTVGPHETMSSSILKTLATPADQMTLKKYTTAERVHLFGSSLLKTSLLGSSVFEDVDKSSRENVALKSQLQEQSCVIHDLQNQLARKTSDFNLVAVAFTAAMAENKEICSMHNASILKAKHETIKDFPKSAEGQQFLLEAQAQWKEEFLRSEEYQRSLTQLKK